MGPIILLMLCAIFILNVDAQEGHHHGHHIVDYYAHPHYSYHYGVHDPKHHDVHSQWEERDGDKVKGQYTLDQPDGRKRLVEYEADKHGVNYKVKYEGHAIHEEGHHGDGGGHAHVMSGHGGGGGGASGGGGGFGGHGHGTHYKISVGHDHHGHGESFIENNLYHGHQILVKGVSHHHGHH